MPDATTPDRETGPERDLGFKRMVSVPSQFSRAEIDEIVRIANAADVPEGTVSGRVQDAGIRRSQVHWLRRRDGYQWVYDRLWPTVEQLNRTVFGFDITGFGGSVQVARYGEHDEGFYNWHMDNGDNNAGRKISLSVQLTDPATYEGGDLELFYKMRKSVANRSQGAVVAFPSFVMHRVTPVTRGIRHSLVAWITGPRWR